MADPQLDVPDRLGLFIYGARVRVESGDAVLELNLPDGRGETEWIELCRGPVMRLGTMGVHDFETYDPA